MALGDGVLGLRVRGEEVAARAVSVLSEQWRLRGDEERPRCAGGAGRIRAASARLGAAGGRLPVAAAAAAAAAVAYTRPLVVELRRASGGDVANQGAGRVGAG